jgi:hypothetical protein
MTENFHLLLNVVVYFLNFSSIICMMFVITANFSYFDMVKQIFTNWSQGFIEEIKLVNKTKSEKENVCPSDYEYLFKFDFPGTRVGCNCLGVENITDYPQFQNKLISGSCSSVLTKFGCQTVSDIPSKSLHSFGDKYYCVRRTGFNYFLNYSNSIYAQCPSNFKSCGIIDSLSNFLCLEDKDQLCPWTSPDKLNYNGSHILNLWQEDNTEKFPDLIKYYTKFYLQFGFSQSEICINSEEINILSNEVYELFNKRKTMKCATQLSDISSRFKYDYRYQPLIITKTNMVFFYEDFLKTNLKNLPTFPKDFFDDPLILHGRNYIGWNRKCKDYLLKFITIGETAQNIKKFSVYYLVFGLFILIYCMLFIMIFKELIFERYFLKILIILVHVTMIFIISYLLLKDYVEVNNSIELCLIIIKRRCSDEETNRLIIFVLEIFIYISNLFLISIVLYLIMILLSLVKIILTVYKIYKRNILSRLILGNINEFEMVLLL